MAGSKTCKSNVKKSQDMLKDYHSASVTSMSMNAREVYLLKKGLEALLVTEDVSLCDIPLGHKVDAEELFTLGKRVDCLEGFRMGRSK